ncbi:hypothetical protein OGV25_14340 [Pseudomonas sp. P1B16]|uniref:hypothetical protein n=1 Tax=Pseudomonas sp. P1B16 TaxID=2986074 RepID=UPI002A24C045|nr:hypothetical protein [Pseudomonas sp. P1B16]WPM24548.1 hypothetical protein OGV25_14340 [Pseudomonas sp. P1B16]
MVSDAYARQADGFFTDADLPVLRRIFQSNDPSVLRNSASIARQIAKGNPALALEMICTADMVVSPQATHDFFMLLASRSILPAGSISFDQWRILLRALERMPELDDHWVVEFLKQAVEVVPADVVQMMKGRLQAVGRCLGYRSMRRDRSGAGLGLLAHRDGHRLLQELLTWAVDGQVGEKLTIDIGACVSGLCGKYEQQVLDLLLLLIKGGGQAHVNVVASALRSAYQSFVIQETSFVRELLSQAELISEKAVRDISSALWSSAVSGGRSGLAGEPFSEDLALREHAEKTLKGMSRMDPAYRLYGGAASARQGQHRSAGRRKARDGAGGRVMAIHLRCLK